MGNVYRGLPPYLVEVAIKMGVTSAGETGTDLGETAILLADVFDEVSTVEASLSLWKSTKKKFEKHKNINSFFGDSPTVLSENLIQNQNYFFWLDAHWSGDITFGEGNPCPVLKELTSIKNANLGSSSLVCIDDARLFSAPHQLAPLMNGWPRMSEIFEYMDEMNLRTFIFDDVVLGISPDHEDLLMDYLLEMIVSREDTVDHDFLDSPLNVKLKKSRSISFKMKASAFFIRLYERKR